MFAFLSKSLTKCNMPLFCILKTFFAQRILSTFMFIDLRNIYTILKSVREEEI